MQGLVRIIAGKWRGRRLTVPEVKDLRPTPDRVRETVFNWLAPNIVGAHCLDLFSGSGALGFEAASRGAASVQMVDQSLIVIKQLQDSAALLKADNVQIVQAAIPHHLRKPARPYDIVFIDPPYQQDFLLPVCDYLEKNAFLANFAYIYLEANKTIEDNELPANWRLLKSKRAGQVAYHLAQRVEHNE